MRATPVLLASEFPAENPVDWGESILVSLRDAGWTLMRLRVGGHSLGFRLNTLETMIEEEDDTPEPRTVPPRCHPPAAWEIDHMDHVLQHWISGVENVVHRRVLSYRMLYDPETERYMLSLRRIARHLGCSPPAVQYWHEKALTGLGRRLSADRNEVLKTLLYVRRRTGLYSR